MNVIKVAGTISLIGVLSEFDGKINPLPIVEKSLCINGIFVGSRAMQQRFHDAVMQYHIYPIIGTVFKFEQANEVYAYQLSAQHLGKVVVKVN